VRHLGVAALALLTLGVGVAHAQGTPPDRPLPPIPDSLPAAVRDSLSRVRARTLRRTEAFNARVPDFTARCGTGRIPAEDTARLNACGAEFTGLRALSDSVVREKSEFIRQLESAIAANGPYAAVERQLAQDRMALVRQQRVSELLVSELESWAKENADAQAGALKVGLTTLFGSAAKQLQTREASATAFRGVLTRYEREMRARGIPFDVMRERIERAARGYVAARVQATAGTVMGHAADANDLWNFARTEAGVIAAAQAGADADVKAAMSDPTFQRFIQTDATAADLVRGTLDQMAGTPALEPLTKPYALAAFLVDYGYEASRWAASRARILQGAQLSDEQLKAVAALSAQMERTVARLQACRAAGR
jgi:hypothetical protein